MLNVEIDKVVVVMAISDIRCLRYFLNKALSQYLAAAEDMGVFAFAISP